MPPRPEDLAEAGRIRAQFLDLGAQLVKADVLQPAETLLDLYGEDIRARAYLTSDPHLGEIVLRPDFTVPIVQQHLASGNATARYAYAGKVFRKQDDDPSRPRETIQVGYEVFDAAHPAQTDAEVFAAVAAALDGLPVTAVTGDIGILRAAIAALRTSDERKAALSRHLWRPRKFKALLDRFGGRTAAPAARTELLAQADPFADAPPLAGLRSRAEIAARIDALRADAATAPISSEELGILDAILALNETLPNVLSALRDIIVDMPPLAGAVQIMSDRMDAMAMRGIAVDDLAFEGSYGRTSMEYYDGFVFGFSAKGHDLPPVATGGRYDALAAQLGHAAPAVGAVVRPELVNQLKAVS